MTSSGVGVTMENCDDTCLSHPRIRGGGKSGQCVRGERKFVLVWNRAAEGGGSDCNLWEKRGRMQRERERERERERN